MHGWCIDECCDVILVVHAYITFLLFSHNISRQREESLVTMRVLDGAARKVR